MARPLGDADLPSSSSKAAGLAIFLDTDQGVSGVMSGNPGARSPAAAAPASTRCPPASLRSWSSR
jgi:hypothetical protein